MNVMSGLIELDSYYNATSTPEVDNSTGLKPKIIDSF